MPVVGFCAVGREQAKFRVIYFKAGALHNFGRFGQETCIQFFASIYPVSGVDNGM